MKKIKASNLYFKLYNKMLRDFLRRIKLIKSFDDADERIKHYCAEEGVDYDYVVKLLTSASVDINGKLVPVTDINCTEVLQEVEAPDTYVLILDEVKSIDVRRDVMYVLQLANPELRVA